jgi:hypothetical protein
MYAFQTYGAVVGRILIALIFILSGIGKWTGFQLAVGYIASHVLPVPQLGAIGAMVVEGGARINCRFPLDQSGHLRKHWRAHHEHPGAAAL